MKKLLAILFLVTSTVSWAQEWKYVDSISFCSKKIIMPADCEVGTRYTHIRPDSILITDVRCTPITTWWIYPDKNRLDSAADQMASNYYGGATNLKKRQIKPYVLGKEVNGYITSFEYQGSKICRIVAYGIINNQPVVVGLTLTDTKEPKTNDDLPEFTRKIMTLTKPAATAKAQDPTKLDSVSFCFRKYKVPEGLEIKTHPTFMGTDIPDTEVFCSSYQTEWIYPDKNKLDSAANKMASVIQSDATLLEKKEIKLYLLGQEVKGYDVIYELQKYSLRIRRLVAYGIVNGQPVVVRFTPGGLKEPKTNDDLPVFTRQIMTLSK